LLEEISSAPAFIIAIWRHIRSLEACWSRILNPIEFGIDQTDASSQPLAQVKPSAPNAVYWFVHCVHPFERMLYDNAQLARVYVHAW
jgi:hypothetical protein